MKKTWPTVKTELTRGTATLTKHRCKAAVPAREAEELLAWAAGVSRESLYAHPERRLTKPQLRRFRAAVTRRVAHAPLEYLTGIAGFMGREFRVTPATLIPRPATETLLEEAIIVARNLGDATFIDVGTGSGAIAITLAAAFPAARVLATDLSPAALAVARANARRHHVADRIHFVKADLLPGQVPSRDGATVIVANLPYIPSTQTRRLAPEIRRYEPKTALFGGRDGLAPSKRLIDRIAASRVVGAATALFEVLPNQCMRLEAYAKRRLPGWQAKRVLNDQGMAVGMVFSKPRGS